jgi:hypothetical protein
VLDEATRNPEWLATTWQLVDDPDLHITTQPGAYQVAIDLHPGDPPP